LLVHRTPARRWCPDWWDLPGGHVEEGESAETALTREQEERGVDAVVIGDAFAQVRGMDSRMDISSS
jgi:8-oxo-dGTP pyrophosphatase MutT (NUDIX family)